ncbi:MAG: 1-acyl-sn-glycerol-3-phosphate acyltransferase [Candidatus Fermentibacteraceae bacterium]|nr:1-acyl-sn-glycerol-3-phosphate acyltransferase [Candidatus Fermentibacteraceae bacterium]MBN2607737.1 1-acyl-sn-glycerol-3-phosphate acyltransferase [Candidatus Fermentibacteraceae bacterium]
MHRVPGVSGDSRQSGAGRFLLITSYTVVFWFLLPGFIVAVSLMLDRWLELGFQAGHALTLPASILLAVFFPVLITAVVQFRLQTGEWPISSLPSDRLALRGLYSIWRHPVYLFYCLCLLPIAVLVGSGGMLLLVLPVFYLVVVLHGSREERDLRLRLGECAQGRQERTGIILPRLQTLLRLPVLILVRTLLRVKVRHTGTVPGEGPVFILAPHRSYLDPVFVACATGRYLNFVTTYQMFRNSGAAVLFRRLGCIPRKRHTRDMECVRLIAGTIRRCGAVVVFPEGERSWTGGAGPVKNECLKLLELFPDVPVVLMSITGSYGIWPRWRSFPSSGEVAVKVLESLRSSSCTDLESRVASMLRDLTEPASLSRRRTAGRGIEKVLYRCPACLLQSGYRHHSRGFQCRACGQRFRLAGLSLILEGQDGSPEECSIPVAYRSIRYSAGVGRVPDVPASCPGVAMFSGPSGGSLTGRGKVAVRLDEETLRLDGAVTTVIRLADISSVTTEGSERLHVLDGRHDLLYQLRFTRQSVLMWQDMTISMAELSSGRAPNRS